MTTSNRLNVAWVLESSIATTISRLFGKGNVASGRWICWKQLYVETQPGSGQKVVDLTPDQVHLAISSVICWNKVTTMKHRMPFRMAKK